MRDRKKLITLRVDEDVWETFKKLAKYNDSDAAKEMRKMIKRYIAENANLMEVIMRKEA
jgi:hypothetical protein